MTLLLLSLCFMASIDTLLALFVVQVNNVIDPFKYTEVPFGSKSELKEYLKVSGKRSRVWCAESTTTTSFLQCL